LAWALSEARRDAVREHLAWVLGRPPSRREVRQTFVNFAHCLAESLGSAGHPSVLRALAPNAALDALRGESGIVLITAHTGAWELAAQQLRRHFDREVVLVMRAEDNDGARVVHERLRDQNGLRAVYAGAAPLVALGLRDELLRGAVLAFQLDRTAPSGRGLEARLFGRPYWIPEGPLRLARSTAAPIVSAFAAREAFLEHRLEVHPPLYLERGCSSERMREVAQTLVSRFEEFVRRYPDQWFHFDASVAR
jgi:KDO2-lipid IV(A) lauroyltransferase